MHGACGEVSLLTPSLPAATANNVVGDALMALSYVVEVPAPPRLTLATFALILPAYTKAVGDVGDAAGAGGVEDLDRDDLRPEPAARRCVRERRDAGHAERVVGARRDRARDVRAVVVVVLRVVVAVDEVPAAVVVDAAVGVVVDAVGLLAAAALARVGEHVRRQVGVVRATPVSMTATRTVDAESDAHVPCLCRVDVGIHRARPRR